MNLGGGYVGWLEPVFQVAFWLWFPILLVLLLIAAMGSRGRTRWLMLFLLSAQVGIYVGTMFTGSFGNLQAMQTWRWVSLYYLAVSPIVGIAAWLVIRNRRDARVNLLPEASLRSWGDRIPVLLLLLVVMALVLGVVGSLCGPG